MEATQELKNITCKELSQELGISWCNLRFKIQALSESPVMLKATRELRKEAQFYAEVSPSTKTTLSSEMHSLILSQYEESKDLITAKELAKKFNLCWLRKNGSFKDFCTHMSKSDRDHYVTFNIFAPKNMFVFTTNKGTRFVQKYLKFCCQNTGVMYIQRRVSNSLRKYFLLEEIVANVWTKGRIVGFAKDSKGVMSPIICAYKSTPPLQLISDDFRPGYNLLKRPFCEFDSNFSCDSENLPFLLQFDLQKDIISNKTEKNKNLLNALIAGIALSVDTKVDIHYEGSICMISVNYLKVPNRVYSLEKHKAFVNQDNKEDFIKHFGKTLKIDDLLKYIKKHSVYDDECVIRYKPNLRCIQGYRKNTNHIHEIVLDDGSYKDAALIARKSGISTAALLGGIVQGALKQIKVAQ